MFTSFDLQRVTFVSGLHWQVLSVNPSEYKSEVRKLAKHLNFDLAIVRTSGMPQVGFAATNEGYKQGMMSAAAVVSKTMEIEFDRRDFIVATQLPDGRYLYVCQSDGSIVSDGDMIDSAEAIRARLLDDLTLDKSWEKIIAPMEWGISESIERSFIDLLPTRKGKLDLKHSWWQLKPIEVSLATVVKKLFPVVLLAVVAAAAIIGYQKWQAQKVAEEAARLAAMEQSANVNQLPPNPWKTMPIALEATGRCLDSFDSLKTLWPGNWLPIAATCTVGSGTLSVAWRRGEHGWIKHLVEIEPKATISSDGSMASLIVPIGEFKQFSDESLLDEQVRTLQMHAAAQEVRVPLTLSQPPAKQVLPGAGDAKPVVIPWKEIVWSVKGSTLPPGALVRAMDGPGFRITSIVALINGGIITWEMEGTQYVRN